MPKGWIGMPSPKSKGGGTGWFAELDRAWKDEAGQYAVMARDLVTEWGVVTHACMTKVDGREIPWREKQRIKNEIFGDLQTAVEVFPPVDELVDEAPMYHIWVLPIPLPFSLKDRATWEPMDNFKGTPEWKDFSGPPSPGILKKLRSGQGLTNRERIENAISSYACRPDVEKIRIIEKDGAPGVVWFKYYGSPAAFDSFVNEIGALRPYGSVFYYKGIEV